jgi:signal transduction histidine kinase
MTTTHERPGTLRAGAPTVAPPATGSGDESVPWRPTRRSDLLDAALTAVLGVAAGVSLYIGGDAALFGSMADYWRPAGVALTVLCVAPLVVRRRFPLAVLAVMTAAFVPLRVLEVPELNASAIALFIALYTAGAYGRWHRDVVRAASVAAIVLLVLWSLATRSDGYEGTVSLALVNALTAFHNVFYLVAAWFLGDLVRNRRWREDTLVRQADELRAAQADQANRAVLDERVRIARELHDIVAHHVSLMGVQAGAARRVLATRPDEVPELLTAIEESSRQAVGEMAQMLGLLRRADGRDDAGADDGGGGGAGGGADRVAVSDPQPSLDRLDGLVTQMREAGLDVVAHVEPPGLAAAELPPAVALSAYRIVQEALTNTLKHAGRGASAQVGIAGHKGAVEVVVSDDGRGTVSPASGASGTAGAAGVSGAAAASGHGLVGMRERVALVGGELRTGRRTGGGYEVRAWLPLDGRRRGER